MLTKQQECELVLSTHWDDLDEIEQIQEKLSDGPIWRVYKTCEIDGICFETYMMFTYDYEFEEDGSYEIDI